LTSAVFGDFLGAGRRHLEAAVAAGECEVAALPAVVPSVYRLVTVMCVYLENLASCDEIEAAGRTDLQAWERAVVDTGAALHIAADCLRHSILDLGPAGPPDGPAPSPARHLDAAATELAAGRDLLHTHITRTPDGLAEGPRVFRTREFAVILRGGLHFQVLVHDLFRGPVPECGVKTLAIIAQLDVPCDIFPCFPACRVHGPVHALDFQRAVERLGQRIVIADAGPPDRLPYPELFQLPGKLGRGIITPAV
jgi:hypothetical protein